MELYARLVASGPMPWEAGDPEDDANLAILEEAALVRRTAHGVEALSPFVPMNALIRSGLDKVARTHETAASLERAWQQRPARAASVEIVRGAASVAAFHQILHDANSLDILNRWPVLRPVTVAPGLLDLLARGVTVNALYDVTLLSDPEALDVARMCIEAGEHARVLPGVPVNMFLTETTASVSLPGAAGPVPDRMLVHAPQVLQALKAIFDAFWSKAIPISADGDAAPGREEDVKMLALLAAGLTDHAIGRELGVSERTVRRRIRSMQALLGAQTRFQLGVQAARQGWISES
ncbi:MULTISPECIES: helix-turn-helix transcriptional regulator [unclassified Micromonospora]|uniref:helix-turn-helix transcriptional regulator n=1 Tax=unclassified Micromonospora TaxID=2617518 RepID=UPI003317E035